MSEDCLKMFTGVVLLIFVIIAGYFFSERNDRKMFLLSSLVFLVINIACLYVLTASLWFLCGAIMNQGAAMVVPMVICSLPNVTSFDGFIDRNLNPKKIKKTPQNGCLFNTACVP